MNNQYHELTKLVQDASQAMGCSLYGMSLTSGKEPAVEVYLDDFDRPVTIEDCTRVAKQLKRLMAVYEDRYNNCHIEVSSPGMNRLLNTLEHFQRVKGQLICVKTKTALADLDQKRFNGRLIDVTDNQVVLEMTEGDDDTLTIPMDQIRTANLRGE